MLFTGGPALVGASSDLRRLVPGHNESTLDPIVCANNWQRDSGHRSEIECQSDAFDTERARYLPDDPFNGLHRIVQRCGIDSECFRILVKRWT